MSDSNRTREGLTSLARMLFGVFNLGIILFAAGVWIVWSVILFVVFVLSFIGGSEFAALAGPLFLVVFFGPLLWIYLKYAKYEQERKERAEKERKVQEERQKTHLPMIGAVRTQEYTLTMFQPHLSFTLREEGWEVSEPETFNKFGLRHPRFELQLESNTLRESLELEFNAVGWVFDSDRPSSREVVEMPRDMVAWLQKHPYLETKRLTTATIGGIDGNQIDISISREAPKDSYSSWLPLWPVYYSDFYKGTNPGEFHLSEGFEYRVTALDIEGKTITISVVAHEGYLDEVCPRASGVLESIRWQI